VKGPQHYIKHLKIRLLVLLWYNSDVSFPILGYRYLNRAKFLGRLGGAAAPAAPPLNTPMVGPNVRHRITGLHELICFSFVGKQTKTQ